MAATKSSIQKILICFQFIWAMIAETKSFNNLKISLLFAKSKFKKLKKNMKNLHLAKKINLSRKLKLKLTPLWSNSKKQLKKSHTAFWKPTLTQSNVSTIFRKDSQCTQASCASKSLQNSIKKKLTCWSNS